MPPRARTSPRPRTPKTAKPAGVNIDLNLSEFTIGELDDVETMLDCSIQEAFPRRLVKDTKGERWEQTQPRMKVILAFIVIILRRRDPQASMADARAVPIGQLTIDLGGLHSD